MWHSHHTDNSSGYGSVPPHGGGRSGSGGGWRRFLGNILSSTLGVIIGVSVMAAIGAAAVVGIIAGGMSAPAIENNSVLTIRLSGLMSEYPADETLPSFLGTTEYGQALSQVMRALEAARTDRRIKAVVLEAGLLQADPATLQELRQALTTYKKSGKPLYAYGDNYTQASYYLCSAADRVVLNPSGIVEWRGLSARTMYYTDLLRKLGVRMQVFKVGNYKSAVEPYIRRDMSPQNREQVSAFVSDIWQTFLGDVSRSRHIDKERLNLMADNFTGSRPAGELVKARLVDTLMYKEDFYDSLRKRFCPDEDEIPYVDAPTLSDAHPDSGDPDNTVAIYYAQGEVVDTKEMGLTAQASIAADQVIRDLRSLREDQDVKAVVLRINSGGGSAYASEQIWHAVSLLRKEKPVVVSMGGMAASGAYYIACGADCLFAEPTTLTGSIGIFGLVPDLSGLLQDKLSLHFDVVKTNPLADAGTLTRPFSEQESRLMQDYVDNGYRLFLSRVAAGRRMSTDRVNQIGQGHVWTGLMAAQIGLVDKLGTLKDAVSYAAHKAGLSRGYAIRECPEIQPWYISLGLSEAQAKAQVVKTRARLGDLFLPYLIYERLSRQSHVQARLPYLLTIE